MEILIFINIVCFVLLFLCGLVVIDNLLTLKNNVSILSEVLYRLEIELRHKREEGLPSKYERINLSVKSDKGVKNTKYI